jgi:hypothetical protein
MHYHRAVESNVYFELTRRFNSQHRRVVLGSGQAVVYHRLAIMSKDGDWIIREEPEACRHVLAVLAARGARYRFGAPLDVRWLAGGWSSHLELEDERGRRVRCDFFSRPPRIPKARLEELFATAGDPLAVVDVETLIAMKQTQRAKDHVIIGEVAKRLPPERELELTTDPDRVIALAGACGRRGSRPAVDAWLEGGGRSGVVRALAEEVDALQLADRARLEVFTRASEPYFDLVRKLDRSELALPSGHDRLVALAEDTLPEDPHVDAE